MSQRHVALLRGINVGRAKRIAMADLRELFVDLGFDEVRTLLNSGNVVFTASRAAPSRISAQIEKALVDRIGISSRVTVLPGSELTMIVASNPLLDIAEDPSRLLVAFLATTGHRARLESLTREDWSPGALALGERVAWLWCPDGILGSRLPDAIGRLLGDAVTTRNWSTVLKLEALASGG